MNEEKEVYIYVKFIIKAKSVIKLIEFLKANTKTFNCWWRNNPIGEPEK